MSIVKRILLLCGCTFALYSSCAEEKNYYPCVDILGECIPGRTAGCRYQVVTNALVATDDSPYIKSEWRYSPITGMLIGVKKYSRVLARDLSREEKGKLMSVVQRQLQPRVVGHSSVLKENVDGNGEIRSESGTSAKVTFVERGSGTQMLVDVVVTEKFICQSRCRRPDETIEKKKDLSGIAEEVFKLCPADLSTNGVEACRFMETGVRGGFRFPRPKLIANDGYNALMCYFDHAGRLCRFALYKFVQGRDGISEAQVFMDSEENRIARFFDVHGGILPQVEAKGRKASVITAKNGVRVEISFEATDEIFGVVCIEMGLVDG